MKYLTWSESKRTDCSRSRIADCGQSQEVSKGRPRNERKGKTHLLPTNGLVLPSQDLLLKVEHLGTDLPGELLVHGGGRDKVLRDGLLDLPFDDRSHCRGEGTRDLVCHLGPYEHTLDFVRQGLRHTLSTRRHTHIESVN